MEPTAATGDEPLGVEQKKPGACAASDAWLGVVALALCAAFWSLNGPLIKLLNDQGAGLSGVTIACYRSLVGGVVFLPFALRGRRTLANVPRVWWFWSVATFTSMTAAFVIANTMTAAANAIILQYIAPIVVFLLAPRVLGEKPHWREGVCVGVAMVGVAIIFAGNASGNVAGLVVALAAGVGYGALMVVLRRIRDVAPAVVVCMNTLGSALLLLPWAAARSELGLTSFQALVLVFMGLVQFALPYGLFSWAIRRVEAHKASLITLLETVLNPLWTWLLVAEAPPRATLMGGPVILAGVMGWIIMSTRRGRRAQAP